MKKNNKTSRLNGRFRGRRAVAVILAALLGASTLVGCTLGPGASASRVATATSSRVSTQAVTRGATDVQTSAAAGATLAGLGESVGNLSLTHTQVDGVDEADVVKTDGENIYVLTGDTILIAQVQGSEISEIARVKVGFGAPYDFYIAHDRLVVLLIGGNSYSSYYDPVTFAFIYDISDPADPTFSDAFGQDGMIVDSRLVDGMLYLISDYRILPKLTDADDPQSFVPNRYDGRFEASEELRGMAEPFEVEDLHLLPSDTLRFTVVSAFDIERVERTGSLSFAGNSSTMYLNENNLFLAAELEGYTAIQPLDGGEDESRESERTDSSSRGLSSCTDPAVSGGQSQGDVLPPTPKTQLVRVALNGGRLDLAAAAVVDGVVLNRFSLDEYAGFLRVALTVTDIELEEYGMNFSSTWVEKPSITNSILILDSDLSVVGSIEGMAPEESIHAALLSGEVGYMASSNATGQFYALDLSDSTDPQIMGVLWLTGPSSYLYPFAEGLLIGLGEDKTVTGDLTGHLKLSVIDVSDPFDISEPPIQLIESFFAPALSDYKALFIDADKNIIAFEAGIDNIEREEGEVASWTIDRTFMVFGYDAGTGLYERAAITMPQVSHDTRALIIEGYLYVVNGPHIGVFTLETLEEIAWVDLSA